MLKRFPYSAWLGVLVMAAGFWGVLQVRAGYQFEVQPPVYDLGHVSKHLDHWEGEELPPVDDDTRNLLNAQSMVNRAYHDVNGRSVAVSIAVWLQPDSMKSAAPHVPKLCYTNTGWTLLEERLVQVESSQGVFPMNTLLLERGKDRVLAAYWYQIGPYAFTTIHEGRQIHRLLWGQPRWPATYKIQMQLDAHQFKDGLPMLDEMARLLQAELAIISGEHQLKSLTAQSRQSLSDRRSVVSSE